MLTIQAGCFFIRRDLQGFRFSIDPIGMEGPFVDWWFTNPGTTNIRDTRHPRVEKLLSRGRVSEGNPNNRYGRYRPQLRAHPLSKRGCCEPKMASVLGGILMESNETFSLLPPRRMTDVVWTPPTRPVTTCKSPCPASEWPSVRIEVSLSPRRILISMPSFVPFASRQRGVSIVSLQALVYAHYALSGSHADPEPRRAPAWRRGSVFPQVRHFTRYF